MALPKRCATEAPFHLSLVVILALVQTGFAMQVPGLTVTLACTNFSYTDFNIIADRDNTNNNAEAFRITITDGRRTVLHWVENLGGITLGGPYFEDGTSGVGFNRGATPRDDVRTYAWVGLAGNGLQQEPVYTTTNPDCNRAGPVDSDGDGVADGSDRCPGHDDNIDVDNDDTADGCDSLIDSDNDDVADSSDQCPGQDDTIYANNNGVPDCREGGDSDGDGVPDGSDQCPGHDDNIDVDNDGIPDGCVSFVDSENGGAGDSADQCAGGEDIINTNNSNVPDCLEGEKDASPATREKLVRQKPPFKLKEI
jgi:hypothetical protein